VSLVLVVASCHRNLRLDDPISVKPLLDKVKHVSYVGCDLLLSSHWPQGMEALVTDEAIMRQAQRAATCTYDVAEVALRARARYHLVPALASVNVFWQSPPFAHLAAHAATSTVKPQHIVLAA
jgi:hypothetical protein